MRNILILATLLFGFHHIIIAQGLEISAGYLTNTFYEAPSLNEDPYDPKVAASGSNGFSFGLAVDDVEKDVWPLRFSMRFDAYGGDFTVNSGGKIGSEYGKMSTEKLTVNFGLTFLNVRLIKHLRLNILGLDFGLLLYQKSDGVYKKTDPLSMPSYFEESRNGEEWVSKGYFGLINRIAYEIPLNEKWLLVPQTEIYFGRSTEFRFEYIKVRSRRVMFKIGIIRNFKS